MGCLSLPPMLQSTDLLRIKSASMAGLPRFTSLDLPRSASLPTEGCTTLLGPNPKQGLAAAGAVAAAAAGAKSGGWQQHLFRRKQQQDVVMWGQEGTDEEEEEEEEEGHPVAVLPAPAGLQLLFPKQLLQSGQQQCGTQQQARRQSIGPASLDPGVRAALPAVPISSACICSAATLCARHCFGCWGCWVIDSRACVAHVPQCALCHTSGAGASPFGQPGAQEAAQREASPGAGSPTYDPLSLCRVSCAWVWW